MRHWVNSALSAIEADYQRSADTHLIKLELPNFEGINVYLKDESTHPTGSLKHRLARSLFLYALCNGKIDANTTVVEASSGSTAVSEAYFAKLIGVAFIAVMPKSTSAQKIAQIEGFGGHCHFVDNATQMHAVALKTRPRVAGATSWINLCMQKGQQIGVATTILQKVFLDRCLMSLIRFLIRWL